MEEDKVTIPEYQSYRPMASGPWCRHESVKSLVSVPMKLVGDSGHPFGARERTRPGNNGRAVVQRINQVLTLAPGWDGGHACPVAFDAVTAAVEVLNEIQVEALPVPDVSPSIDGGLLFEWRRNGFELEVWCGPDGSVNVTYDHAGNSWEGDWDECGTGARQVLLHLAESLPEPVG